MVTVEPGTRMPRPPVWPLPFGRAITFAAPSRRTNSSVTSSERLSEGSVSLYFVLHRREQRRAGDERVAARCLIRLHVAHAEVAAEAQATERGVEVRLHEAAGVLLLDEVVVAERGLDAERIDRSGC